MAKVKVYKTPKNAIFTLSLIAGLLLSVYVITDNYKFNLGSKAARGNVVENGTLVLPTESRCNLGNYALISSSGQCNSVVARTVDNMLGSRVKVVGVLRGDILYAESVTFLSKDTFVSPTSTPRAIFGPTRAPVGYETPIPFDDPIY